jgi:hypothetical protein
MVVIDIYGKNNKRYTSKTTAGQDKYFIIRAIN